MDERIDTTTTFQLPIVDNLAYPVPDAPSHSASICQHPSDDEQVCFKINSRTVAAFKKEDWLAVCEQSMGVFGEKLTEKI